MQAVWVVVAIALVACGKSAHEKPLVERDDPPPETADIPLDGWNGDEQTVEDPTPAPVLPPPPKLPAPPSNSPSPKLRLVKCFAAPMEPFVLAGDPDVPGSQYGYHAGAPPTTAYARQPFGLPPQALAKPHILASPNADKKNIKQALNAAIAPYETALLACFQKALADPSEAQHEMTVIWEKTVEVKPSDDNAAPILDKASNECVRKILQAIKLPAAVEAGLEFPVVMLIASRLTPVPQPPRRVRSKGGFKITSHSPFTGAPRDHQPGWSGYRSFEDDDGASLAPLAKATIKPRLPKISACLARLGRKVLTGSVRGLVTIEETLRVDVAGLGDYDSQRCFSDTLDEAKLARPSPTPDKEKRLLCDFTWGEARPLRATVSEYENVVRVHATDIEYRSTRYVPADDLPRHIGDGPTIVVADADAPGSFINAALAFASGINDEVMLTVQTDSGGPFYVGRATMPGFAIGPGAHVGFASAAGAIARCDKPCETHKPCAGAWVGIGDDNVASDLLAVRAETERAGFPMAAVGLRVCK